LTATVATRNKAKVNKQRIIPYESLLMASLDEQLSLANMARFGNYCLSIGSKPKFELSLI